MINDEYYAELMVVGVTFTSQIDVLYTPQCSKFELLSCATPGHVSFATGSCPHGLRYWIDL
jgi:hypothetical protein